ncbi:cupin domain-containing protein [Microbacterium sp. zg.B48]|uniref:cupin domain-containing protein n=1 Tax=Microbacterium sp. zg.B48 TaxID=2969408 RepID=UPI00214ACBCF|nr:cupin domain-containing protein [Microbacterium sp. zg.B48]MCR2765009.1 cupin domain-containing protein [Microbacterium sp. zg.B48]
MSEQVADMGDTSFSTKMVFGNNASLMIASRPAGYHSRPHTHPCEQLNYVNSGELWVCIEDQAYFIQEGDFLRIPEGARHWSLNVSDAPCTVTEVHSPGLHADPMLSDFAEPLFDAEENIAYLGNPVNKFLDETDPFDVSVAESKIVQGAREASA